MPGITDYPNMKLAEALKILGYVQRFGIGIPTARNSLQKNGSAHCSWSLLSKMLMF